MTNNKWPRAVCAGAFVVIIGVWTWIAGKEGLSNIYLDSARYELEQFATTAKPMVANDWARVMQNLIDSLNYSPRNPVALELVGALKLRSGGAATVSANRLEDMRSASLNYHAALSQRPTAPVAWANLALTKLYLDELDDEFIAALRHADELGPWDPEVHRLVLLVSLAAWHRLDTVQRAAAIRTLERAVRRDVKNVTALVARSGRLALLCDIKNEKLKLEEACSQLRQSAGERSSRAR